MGDPNEGEVDAYSIDEFCRRHRISTSFFFKEAKAGRGPRVMRTGTRVLISKEAAADWRRERERAAVEIAGAA